GRSPRARVRAARVRRARGLHRSRFQDRAGRRGHRHQRQRGGESRADRDAHRAHREDAGGRAAAVRASGLRLLDAAAERRGPKDASARRRTESVRRTAVTPMTGAGKAAVRAMVFHHLAGIVMAPTMTALADRGGFDLFTAATAPDWVDLEDVIVHTRGNRGYLRVALRLL